MPLSSRRGFLAITAVVDIAIHGRLRPVPARALASRHPLPSRHLEPVLQALVRDGVLKGTRGPRGGYALGRERRRITASDILRAVDAADDEGSTTSSLLDQVVKPAMAQAEKAFAAALSRITIEDLARRAEQLGIDQTNDS